MIHKMKGRRTAILSRREQEKEAKRNNLRSEGSPPSPIDTNGVNSGRPVRSIEVSQSPPIGFTAVNLRQSISGDQDRRASASGGDVLRAPADESYGSTTGNVTIINGKSVKDASPSVRAEMMKKFLTPSEREAGLTEETVRRSSTSLGNSVNALGRTVSKPMMDKEGSRARSDELQDVAGSGQNPPTVAIPNTPASLMPQSKPSPFERDDGGPFKSEMVRRMDNMWKGDRVIPPCDRCRRLHMDCLKNLTACMGCTKKHAKCSWKEVKASELQMNASSTTPDREGGLAASASEPTAALSAESPTEVNQPSEELLRSASIAQASLDLAGDKPEPAKEVRPPEKGGEPEAREKPETAAPSSPSTARFDVRPPPLAQPLHDAANGRSPPGPAVFASPFSPRDKGKEDEYEDDEGDRLQALAARVYRSASQSGHRAQ